MNETGARRLGFRTSRELALHTLVFVVALDASGTEVFLELPASLSGIDPFCCSLN